MRTLKAIAIIISGVATFSIANIAFAYSDITSSNVSYNGDYVTVHLPVSTGSCSYWEAFATDTSYFAGGGGNCNTQDPVFDIGSAVRSVYGSTSVSVDLYIQLTFSLPFGNGDVSIAKSLSDYHVLLFWNGSSFNQSNYISVITPLYNESTSSPVYFNIKGNSDGFIYKNFFINYTNVDKLISYSATSSISGDFLYTSSKVLEEGLYQGSVCIEPISGLSGSICKNLQFTVGSSGLIGGMGTSTVDMSKVCNPTSAWFSPSECIYGAIYPSANDVQNIWTYFRDNLASYAPWGYLTRFITIINDNATVTPPNPSFDLDKIDYSNTGFISGTLSFDLWSHLQDWKNWTTKDGKNAWDLMEGFSKVIIGLGMLFYIVNRVLGIEILKNHKPFQEMSGDKQVTDESYRLKETLWKMSQRK